MTTPAILMALLGVALLYGGLTCCIGIAWYHSRQMRDGRNPPENEAR